MKSSFSIIAIVKISDGVKMMLIWSAFVEIVFQILNTYAKFTVDILIKKKCDCHEETPIAVNFMKYEH